MSDETNITQEMNNNTVKIDEPVNDITGNALCKGTIVARLMLRSHITCYPKRSSNS